VRDIHWSLLFWLAKSTSDSSGKRSLSDSDACRGCMIDLWVSSGFVADAGETTTVQSAEDWARGWGGKYEFMPTPEVWFTPW
jgi:hypothetical protein